MSLMRDLQYAGEALDKANSSQMIRNQTLSEKLKDKIAYHEEQLIKIKATLQLLEVNKDFEKLLFLMNEVH